jgi:hypothetical protein
MSIVVLATLVGLAVVAVALLRDEPIVPRGAVAAAPRWQGLPEPADLARVSFPFSMPGYDPAAVDVHFEALVRAYETLWSAAPEDVRHRARLRADARAGRLAPPADDEIEDIDAAVVPAPPDTGETDADALDAEAALSRLEQRGDEGSA